MSYWFMRSLQVAPSAPPLSDELLQAALPGYPLACEWEWNADRGVAARARREPIQREAMAEELGLFGSGTITSGTTRRHRWPLTRHGAPVR